MKCEKIQLICLGGGYLYPYELHIFEDGGHGMSLGTQATASGSSHIDVNVERWIDLADKWLKKRMAFDLNESKVGF